MTDTLGLLVVVLVTAASVQDRDGGRLVLNRARMAMPSIVLVWADGGYAGKLVAFAQQYLKMLVHIVKKPEGQRGFEVLPRRWVSNGPCPGSAIPPPVQGLRTQDRTRRGDGQVGHDRADDPTSRTRPRPPPLAVE